jgi:multidrug efflux system membrane fusion protein
VAQLGARTAVIDSGVQANEQVVIGGQSRLQSGSRVTVLHGKAAQELLNQAAAQTAIP